jgi:hypothetical protein
VGVVEEAVGGAAGGAADVEVGELGLATAGDGAGDDALDVEGGLGEDEDVLKAIGDGVGGGGELGGGVATDGAEADGDGVGLVVDGGGGVVLRDLAVGEDLALEVAGGDDRQRAGGEDGGELGVELLELFAADRGGEVGLRVPGDDAEDAVAVEIAILGDRAGEELAGVGVGDQAIVVRGGELGEEVGEGLAQELVVQLVLVHVHDERGQAGVVAGGDHVLAGARLIDLVDGEREGGPGGEVGDVVLADALAEAGLGLSAEVGRGLGGGVGGGFFAGARGVAAAGELGRAGAGG